MTRLGCARRRELHEKVGETGTDSTADVQLKSWDLKEILSQILPVVEILNVVFMLIQLQYKMREISATFSQTISINFYRRSKIG